MHPTGEHVHQIDFGQTPKGSVGRYWLHVVNDKIGEAVRIPVLVARGVHDGPVLGLTAAVHGNELNGIPVIQSFFGELDVSRLHGIVVGALVINVPGLLREQREFNDGQDLNRIAPGRPDGNTSQVFMHRVVDRVLTKFEVHIDLHTASFGRVNSHYVRADMKKPEVARMARLQNAQIIVDNAATDTTLRGAANGLGIKSITVELRDPNVFQHAVVEDTLIGIRNVAHDLGMLEGPLLCPMKQTVLCDDSYWIFTDEGGILRVHPKVAQRVEKGELLAEVSSIFGDVSRRYVAPEDGIIVGKSVNPLNQTGSRIVHLGVAPREIPSLDDET